MRRRTEKREASKGVGRKIWRTAFGIAVGGSFVLLVSMMIWPVINEVSTGETPQYPDIRPQSLRFGPDLVLERAAETIDELPRWQTVSVDREARVIDAEAATWLFGFTSDMTINIEPHGSGCIVQMRSKSRVGRGDFGQNARNIRLFQSSLEENLSLATAATPEGSER